MRVGFSCFVSPSFLCIFASRLHAVGGVRLARPDPTGGIWRQQENEGISENNSLLTLSLRHQSGCRRYKAFQRWHKCILWEKKTNEWKQHGRKEKGWRGRRRDVVCWRTSFLLWWWRKSKASKSRQKFLKLQKKAFCSKGLLFLSPWFFHSFPSLFSSNMSLLIAIPCSALRRHSTPLRSIQKGVVGLITRSEWDNGACGAGDTIPALMRKDSFSEQAGLSIDWLIMELQEGAGA